jgi:hypothetical protein
MHRPEIDRCRVWLTMNAIFMATLIMVIHSSSAMIYKKGNPDGGNTPPPLFDTSDLTAFILHSVAYYIACFATTIFLLICAAIILAMATMCLDLLAEAFHATQLFLVQARRERERQVLETDAEAYDDTYCDTWNSR